MNINILQAIYEPADAQRAAEIKYCFDYNVKNPLVYKYLHLAGRPTYNTCFSVMRDRATMSKERNCFILMNSDIFMPVDSMRLLNKFISTAMAPLDKVCFALSRWDLKPDGELRFYDHLDSQDTWIFFAPVPHLPKANFFVGGVPGCDNVIAQALHDAGYNLFNPSKSIQTIHYHLNEEQRTYTDAERLPPPYKLIPTCTLEEVRL